MFRAVCPSTEPPSDNGNLSSGALAGIVIGTVILITAVILITGLVVIYVIVQICRGKSIKNEVSDLVSTICVIVQKCKKKCDCAGAGDGTKEAGGKADHSPKITKDKSKP